MPDPQTDDDGPPLTSNARLAALVAALAVVGAAQVMLLPTNPDASWYLYMAARVLDGARPYRDIVETNPPLILILNMGVVTLARWSGASALIVFPTLLLGLIAVSLALTWTLSRGLPASLRQVSLVAWTYLLLVNPGVTFGQREHLLLALILPYAHASAAAARGDRPPRGPVLAAGLLAGVGFALKPFFLPAAAAVEVYLATRRGRRVWLRPEALAMGAVFVAYAAVVAVWTPQYVPMARAYAPLYRHHGPMGPALLASSWRLPLIVAGVAAAWSVARRRTPGWAEVFGLLALGLTAGVYLTGKGWPYHWLPAVSIGAALACGAGALATLRLSPALRRAAAAVGLGVVAPALGGLSLLSTAAAWRDESPFRMARDDVGPGQALLVLSPWVHRAFPLVNETGVAWGMRHPMVWPIAAFYADGSYRPGTYRPLAAMSAPEREFVGEVAHDFAQSRPALLLIDDDPPRPTLPGFDYLRYFAADPRFAHALAGYEPLTRTIHFRVYRRKESRRGARSAPDGRPARQKGTTTFPAPPGTPGGPG